MFDQRFGVFIESAGEGDFTSEDVFVDSHWVLVVERVDSCVHLVNENTQSPPVDGFPMALVEDDFRSNVLGSTADGESSAFIEDFRESEVSEFQVTIVGDKKILWLEVSEDDIFAVQVFEATGDSSCVEPRLVSGE